MGWEIIIAAVFASMVTRSWEHSRRRSKAKWEEARREAREHAEQRARERVQRAEKRAQRRRDRVDAARQAGPGDPMWWAWGTGWLVAAAARASYAAAAGAREGATVGAREGYRIGHERAQARRDRRGQGGASGDGDPPRTEPQGEPRGSGEAPSEELRSDPSEAVPCVDCGVSISAAAADAEGRCRWCAVRTATPGGDDRDSEPGGDDPDVFDPDVVDAEVVDSTDEPAQEGSDMTEPTAGRAISMNGSNLSGGDGEGYASTIALLQQVGQLLDHVDGVMNDLGDMVASKHVDNATVQGVSDVEDNLQAASNRCGELLKHVQAKHEEVAAAVAGAGGSDEVADTDWYDNY